mmetsp:Transcript_11328/g.24156  ORF Transcript_11328/g.24156 Transcript_11328/m.24156 type:complete len:92 (-) Transcript_11328:1112-1387(-)
MQGMIATARVINALANMGRRMSRKPSIMYCPVNVVVMAALCPADRRAIAKRTHHALFDRKEQKSASPTSSALSFPCTVSVAIDSKMGRREV